MIGFWQNKKVFVTGHTGFKGSWLSMLLHQLGAKVVGYATKPPTNPSLFELCQVEQLLAKSVIADIRNLELLKKEMEAFQPDIVIHMAAQPLVRESYQIPVDTYAINVMGTVHLFEAVKHTESVRAVVNVTTDKCYDNKEWAWGYRENEPLGGHDPYSSSKACSELVTSAYRNSYFHDDDYDRHGVAIATARAGNVIGGGDWARDRLIPDCIQSLLAGEPITIRNPHSIRPWQHVLEPLNGYLGIAQKLYESGVTYAGAWNFGPEDSDAKPVEWIVRKMCEKWQGNAGYVIAEGDHLHEATYLKLDCSKAKQQLKWTSRWDLNQALDSIIEWTHAYKNGTDLRSQCFNQMNHYYQQTAERI